MATLGIDIGGTGIKGAPVDTQEGRLLAERLRVLTPQPATPEAVAAALAEVVRHFEWSGPVGCGFPGVVQQGIVRVAAHLDKHWIGANAPQTFAAQCGCPVTVLNDADAAGLAELRFGAGRGHSGLVVMVTLGTGIGTALFMNGQLVPNTELGHLEIRGKEAELRASDRARQLKGLTWKKWAVRIDEYLLTLERLFWPQLFIIGGGGSKYHKKFIPRLTVQTPVVPAELLNEAGIIGAALAAEVE